MKKKFLAVLLVLVCGLMFAGCGNFVDDYTVKKDIKINNEATAVELEDFKNEYANAVKDLNKMEVISRFEMDSGEIEVMGKKTRTTSEVEVKMVIDSEDAKNPMFGVTIKGKAVQEIDGETVGRITIKGSEYYKEGYIYVEMSTKGFSNIDGEKNEEETNEKYKEAMNLDTDSQIEVPQFGEMDTDISALIDEINSLIEEIRGMKGAEIGKDKKGNLVFQVVNTDKDGKRNCMQRVVFAGGLPVYYGMNLSKLGEGIMVTEAGINCNKGSIHFPNLNSYEEKK